MWQAPVPTAVAEARPVGGMKLTLPPLQRRAMSGVHAPRGSERLVQQHRQVPDACRIVRPMLRSVTPKQK